MNESQRIDHLIKLLAGNNARVFANMTGIRTDSLSRIRNGKGKPSLYFEKILAAYPEVERDWLYYGAGDALRGEKEKGEILAKLESLEREVARLAGMVEELLKCQQSANGK